MESFAMEVAALAVQVQPIAQVTVLCAERGDVLNCAVMGLFL